MGFKHSRNVPPSPKNNTSVDVARSTLQQLAPVIVKQYQNALAVNGYDCQSILILLYKKLDADDYLKCRNRHKALADEVRKAFNITKEN